MTPRVNQKKTPLRGALHLKNSLSKLALKYRVLDALLLGLGGYVGAPATLSNLADKPLLDKEP